MWSVLCLALTARLPAAQVERVVIIKVDGLPERLLERYARPATDRPRLPWIAQVFGQEGVWLDNFYSRGLSLSAPSWSLLDTGRPLEIHGNVEYDRYTLRAWDYLNFFPFYVGYAMSRRVDMPGVEWLDQQGVPLLIDRFAYDQRYQSFQLLQRGIRWSTLQSSLQAKFTSRPLKDLFDEWQTGFSMSIGISQALEKDLVRELKDPKVRYLDYFTGEYDHVAHLTPDRIAQLHVLESLDALVGRLWTAIHESPLADSTALVLVSDHGMNTVENLYSQGYNLVEWFGSGAGGGHHVITDRHPLTEFKLKGLDPFVSEVITPSRESAYLNGQSAEYPTVVLDLDGNERANIGLRDNALNVVHILLDQLTRKRLTGPVRAAAIDALFEVIDRQRPVWEQEAAELEQDVRARLERIEKQEKLVAEAPKKWTKEQRDLGLDKEGRRALDLLNHWKSEARADSEYLAARKRLLALAPADFDPGKFKMEELIPPKSLGDLNSIWDLQHYVVGPGNEGLVLAADGSLDMEKSFRAVDYFAALSAITVRNNVQKNLAPRPVDFIAVRVPREALQRALGSEETQPLEDGIWLWRGADRQALLLTRHTAGGQLELRYLPVANLTEDRDGELHFDRCEWAAGFPLELFEDRDLGLPPGSTRQWLGEWHDERAWLNAVHRSKYSNGVIGLAEQLLDSPQTPPDKLVRQRRLRTDLLAFASDHWNFNVRGFNPGGNHGSLLRASTHSVLLIAGGKDTGLPKGLRIETPYDSLSLVPTILSLMGKAEPALPGPVIEELAPK
jgi:type I phosphodiesterase/nucleotide pyrophosphatase